MKNINYLTIVIFSISFIFYGCNKEDNTETKDGGSIDGHEYVDLGLPSGTLWATCNIGASSPEEYGLYFAWGETIGYSKDVSDGHSFYWSSYKWCKGSETTLTKYCTQSKYGTVDNKTELDSEDDAATQNWGGGWQMPSVLQIKELIDDTYTTTSWTSINNVFGRKVISKINGNYIFLPSGGDRSGTSLTEYNDNGEYWSRSIIPSYCRDAYYMDFDHDTRNNFSNCERFVGLNIRPVHSK